MPDKFARWHHIKYFYSRLRYGIAFTNGGNQSNYPVDVCEDGFAVRASVDVETANYSSPFADASADAIEVSQLIPPSVIISAFKDGTNIC